MKVVYAVIFIFLFVVSAIYVLASGSGWSFVSAGGQKLYSNDQGPLDTTPVIETMTRAESATVEKCILDKDDAYLQVRSESGKEGYLFDHRQHYKYQWRGISLNRLLNPDNAGGALDCYRLVGQFGR